MWSISAAGADESPADPPVIEIEGLTVTATKTERSTFEVPASVSIIGPERIESEEPQSIGDLLEELPNVEVISGPRRIGETANMRGFDEECTEVGLRFRTTDGLTTWGSYAEAFRAPGLTEAFAEDLHFRRIPGVFPDNFFVPNPDLKPETTSTLEAAMRTRFADLLIESDRLRLEAACFDTDAGGFIDLEVDIVGGTTRPDKYSGCRAPRFRDRARIRRIPLLRGHELFGDAGQGCNDERATRVRPPGQARGDARPERSRFVKRQDEVLAEAPVTPGYGVCDLYVSWLPAGSAYSGARIDFGIDNLTDKAYRRHLSLIDKVGRNFRASVSYRS